MKIRSKLTLALLLASSLPLIIFIAISSYLAKNNATKSAMAENLKAVEIVQNKINNLISSNLSGLKLEASNPGIQSYDVEKIKPILASFVKVYPQIYSNVVTKPDGKQLVKSDTSALSSVADRAYFQQALKGDTDVVSEILLSKSTGHLITVLATPIKDNNNGNITGVIQGSIELTSLNNFVKDLSKNNVTFYILDKDGKMLAHPSKAFKTLEERTDLSKFSFVKDGLLGKTSSKEVVKDNKDMLVSYMQDPKTGWLICAEIPKNIAVADSIRSAIFTALIGLAILIIVCLIVFVIVGYAIKPINSLLAAANNISEGNLNIDNIDIKSKDEIGDLGRAFKNMVVNLQEMVINIKLYSSRVLEASNEMLSVSEQQAIVSTSTAENANEIASGNELVNTSIDKISSNVFNLDKAIDDINRKSNIVSTVVKDASNYSEMGSNALIKVNSSMEGIENSVNNTALVINKLAEHSKAIGEITEVIKGISEQTNLLALNAAIEAARAGEQGKGFAVVADEVRKLAEQSGEAAEEVNTIINGIQEEAENAIFVMDKGIIEVKDGSSVIKETNSYFEQIFKAIQEIAINIKEVNGSIGNIEVEEKEISSNLNHIIQLSEKVSGEIQGISAATEEQVASIEEMTASAQSLAELAVNLKNSTSKFKTE